MSKNVKKPQISVSSRQQQVQQNGPNTEPVNTPNGMRQFQVPTTTFMDVPVMTPTTIPAMASWAAPVFVDLRIGERVEPYARWLSANNSLPASPQKLQAYQDASLEVKKIGKREVRTFAPFQEHTSALQVITARQLMIVGILAGCWLAGLFRLHLALFTVTVGMITLLYICGFVVSGILATKSVNGSSGEKIDEEIIAALDQRGVEWPAYTILCPLYKESAIVPQFVEAIKALKYPAEKLQVLFLTEEDDHETRAALYSMRLPRDFTILTVPKGSPQTKPRACNFGLLQAKGQFIVIFDAEDKPEPYQLKKAVLAFANHGPEVACVQAKLNYYNSTQNLLTRWFTAEYSTWFDIMLPGLQQRGFSLPLGGTSNHFRTEVLRALGGWDAFNVTEDCDLGLRISQYGLKTAVLDSTTYEEATSRVKSWLFQRSRWIKGYLQTYLVHMRHPVQTLRRGQFRKFFSLQLIVGAWTIVLLINPFMWALTALYLVFRPVQLYSILFPGPILYMGAFCLVFGNFFYVYIHLIGCLRRKEYALIKWVLLIPLYWVMMSVSAYIAFYQLIVKPHYWEKTQHGNHLAPSAQLRSHRFSQNDGQDEKAVVVSMPTTHLFAVTVGRIFKQVAAPNELGTTTQRVKAVRGTLSTRLGQHKVPRQIHLPRIRDRWLLAVLVLASCWSIGCCTYFFLHHEIALYPDAFTHMRLSRAVFDSATPGLAQLGTVWPPLPHILMWPFIWNNLLWQTGLAGASVSMLCYVFTCACLFCSARRITHRPWPSLVGTLVFLLNPNILYLQSTPMSELVCIACFSLSVYLFIRWMETPNIPLLVLMAASVCLATLARFDGWGLFVALCVLIPLFCLNQRWGLRQTLGTTLVYGLLGGLGIGLWLIWNQIIAGNAFYFQSSIYSSRYEQSELLRPGLLFAYHSIVQSVHFYTFDAVACTGIVCCILALLGIYCLLVIMRTMRSVFLLGILLVPFVFYVTALYTGDAVIWLPGANPPISHVLYYNVRYVTQLIPSLAILASCFCASVDQWFPPRLRLVTLGICMLLILGQVGSIVTTGIITLKEGEDFSACYAQPTTMLYLAQHYEGGYVLEDASMVIGGQSVEWRAIDFHDVVYDGSGPLWYAALRDPTTVSWVMTNPRNSLDLVARHLNLTSFAFLQHFTLVARQTDGTELFHRNGTPLTPVHPAPIVWTVPHDPC
jgi:cellulose synthase/poly-beta-1,6-N-acetylglucosamine synthase-like glycosyltransferase